MEKPIMAIDLSKIKAKLQAEKQVVDAVDPAKEGSDSTVIATVETSTATGESKVTALEVAQQIQEKVRALPTPDPKLSDTENLTRELDARSLHGKIEELRQALLAEHPTMPLLLKDIHSTLQKQPDNITLVDDDEIGTIFQALMKYTNTSVALTAIKKGGKGAPKITGNVLDALGF